MENLHGEAAVGGPSHLTFDRPDMVLPRLEWMFKSFLPGIQKKSPETFRTQILAG